MLAGSLYLGIKKLFVLSKCVSLMKLFAQINLQKGHGLYQQVCLQAYSQRKKHITVRKKTPHSNSPGHFPLGYLIVTYRTAGLVTKNRTTLEKICLPWCRDSSSAQRHCQSTVQFQRVGLEKWWIELEFSVPQGMRPSPKPSFRTSTKLKMKS